MSSTLDSEAAFIDRAQQIGLERWVIDKIRQKKFATFGRLAFGFAYSPQSSDEAPLREFLTNLLDEAPSDDQLASLRRLFFESHTMALTDVRQRVESNPDPSVATRKLPTAERVARQQAQEKRLGGLVFNPTTIPSNHLHGGLVCGHGGNRHFNLCQGRELLQQSTGGRDDPKGSCSFN